MLNEDSKRPDTLTKRAMNTKFKFESLKRLARSNNADTTFNASFTKIGCIMREIENRHATNQLLFHIKLMTYYGQLIAIG